MKILEENNFDKTLAQLQSKMLSMHYTISATAVTIKLNYFADVYYWERLLGNKKQKTLLSHQLSW